MDVMYEEVSKINERFKSMSEGLKSYIKQNITSQIAQNLLQKTVQKPKGKKNWFMEAIRLKYYLFI